MDLKRMVKDYRDLAVQDSHQAVLEHARLEDSPEDDDAQLGRLMRAHEQALMALRKYFDKKNRLEAQERMRPLAFDGVRP